jgi:preprotein translocase subunit SecF
MKRSFAFKFIEKRKLFYTLSSLLILAGFIMMGLRALSSKPILNWGIDFVGGSTITVKYPSLNKTDYIEKTRNSLAKIGQEKASIVITPENEVIIKTSSLKPETIKHIQTQLQQDMGTIEIQEVDFIGPTIGAELQQKSLFIIITVIASLLIFISWRFQLSYGLGAIAALIHDALATISIASLLYFEIDSAFIAALLTVLGYSMNDTIIIFDRIRENIAHAGENFNIIDITNLSLNQTLARTINTVTTALIMLLAMILLGGSTIRTFLLVMFIGIALGTYSSIFIGSPIFVHFFARKRETTPVAASPSPKKIHKKR